MKGLQNFLQLLNENYVSIIVCIGLVIGLIQKVKSFIGKSDEEKLEIAKKQIHESMLRLITSAEKDYGEWAKAGSIKRSQVIEEIYKLYPILSRVINQEELIEWIDNEIDNSLKTLREILKENKNENKNEE